MPSLLEFQPLRQETVDTIRARIDSNVNAGLDRADPRWQETTPGGFWFDHTQSFALEEENLWDFASTELPASFFLPFSFGIYLDYWGELLDVPRKQPAYATGAVYLTNSEPEPQVVAGGLEVAAPAVAPSDAPVTFVTTETVEIPAGGTTEVQVQATESGTQSNVAAHAVQQITSPSSELSVVNEQAISGGEDEELDEPYKARLLLEFQGARGGGTQDDYRAEALALPSVGNVEVQPHWNGPNTVRLIISDVNNAPVSAAVIEAVQRYFDPPSETGQGAGEAPIDAEVTVATVTITEVSVEARLELEPGFTVGGSGGSVDVAPEVRTVLDSYFRSLSAGRAVQLSRVLAAIISIEGIYDVHVGTLRLNGVAEDAAVSPLASAQLGSITLTSEPSP